MYIRKLRGGGGGIYLTPDAHCIRIISEQEHRHLKRKDVNSNLYSVKKE